ncbi:MAG TPA: type III pantothenate kinase [Clostridiales bacterium]|nr:type III pantothenate kinase [Clostridiales bacterium]
MVFTADISNSCITLAAFDSKGRMLFRSDISSDRSRTEDEYFFLMKSIFSAYGVDPSAAEGAVISSVVPPLSNVFGSAAERLLGCKPLFVGPGVKTGLDIKIDHHSQLGSDLVANTVAAMAAYSKPFIIIDMDTATTFTAVNAKGELCGVIILPGIRVSLDALSANAAELPYISLYPPKALLGTNTIDSMNSGIIYGTACMIDGLIDRLFEEFQRVDINIIATGALAECIIPYCKHKIIHAPNLILDGLYMIYKRNQKKHKQI